MFRSKTAAAYLSSKQIPNLIISSSGIDAGHKNKKISPYTVEDLKRHHIIEYLSKTITRTTKEILEDQDLVIFMYKNHEKYCLDNLNAHIKDYITWNIHDIPKYLNNNQEEIKKRAEINYQLIKNNIDTLIKTMGW